MNQTAFRVIASSFFLGAVILVGCGSDDTSSSSPTADDARLGKDDAGTTTLDAALGDAALPTLPASFTACSTCMESTCAPQIAACNADAYCEQIISCTLTSGCLATDPQSCMSTCAASLNLTPKQTAAELKLLQSIATTCSSCLTQCPRPDAG